MPGSENKGPYANGPPPILHKRTPYIGPLPLMLYSLPRHPLLAVGIPLLLGSGSGYLTANVVRGPWWKSLRAPPGRPPNQAFGIIWPILYCSMGYASHLIMSDYDSSWSPVSRAHASHLLTVYYAQLALNYLWTPLYFGLKQTGLALINVSVLTLTTCYLTYQAKDLPKSANLVQALLIPYCAWLAYATYLNAGYWFLNYSPWAKPRGKGDGQEAIKTL